MFGATVGDLQSVVGVLSAMITPAVLILACGSLIMTTSSRLIRAIDRIREMAHEIEQSADAGDTGDKRRFLFSQLERSTTRARMLQRALTRLYVAVGLFIATSVAIGMISLAHLSFTWIPLVLGLAGAGFLFSASLLLIIESRIALSVTIADMDFLKVRYSRNFDGH
jgi:hypothetical protein